jgi:hypothetical protein
MLSKVVERSGLLDLVISDAAILSADFENLLFSSCQWDFLSFLLLWRHFHERLWDGRLLLMVWAIPGGNCPAYKACEHGKGVCHW